MNDLKHEVKGSTGILYVYEDRVVISRKTALGAMLKGFKGDRTIYYSEMTSIETKKPGLGGGYIKFIVPGANTSKNSFFDENSARDDNTIVIGVVNKGMKTYDDAVEYINGQLSKSKNKGEVSQLSSADEIMKFKTLLDQGIITQEEFDKKKDQLLGI